MIHCPLLELVTRGAWLRQCGAEVSLENIVAIDSGSVKLENARALYLDPIQIAVSNPMIDSFLINAQRSILFPSKVDHSIPVGRPLVQRFSPIRF